MSDDWKAKFRELYQSAQERYRAGRTTTLTLFEPDEVCFLATIGCSTQELFDFCLLSTSDAADDPLRVAFGGRRTIEQ